MSTPLIPPQTAAATEDLPTANYPYVTVTASNLATTETVSISIVDSYGAATTASTWDGSDPALTATVGSITLQGGPTYRFAKSITASADSSVCWSPGKFY